jgi:hypothetical protein
VYKKAKFLFFCMIFVATNIFSQNRLPQKELLLWSKKPVNSFSALVLSDQHSVKKSNAEPFLSPQYYASQLGFFCKQEIKFEKFAKIPVKFRLGGVEECDLLEGKKRIN